MFKKIFLSLSLLSTILFSIFFVKNTNQIWIILISFILSYFACIILFLLFNLIVTLPVNKKKECDTYNKFYHKLLVYDIQFICSLFNIKINTTGLENLPKDSVFMIIQNHRSFIDPLITLLVLKNYPLSFVSKAENFKKPIVGKFLVKNGCISLNREDNRDAVKSVVRAVNELNSKEFSIGIYPEGSRNKTGVGLLPFKHGAFKIAQRANVPIVVSTLEGTEKIKKTAIFNKKIVNFTILGIIEPKNYANTEEISNTCESLMLPQLNKNK